MSEQNRTTKNRFPSRQHWLILELSGLFTHTMTSLITTDQRICSNLPLNQLDRYRGLVCVDRFNVTIYKLDLFSSVVDVSVRLKKIIASKYKCAIFH